MPTLTAVVLSGSGTSTVNIIKPANTALHQAYIFYMKVSALGGSYAWFGPYTLNIGCFAASVTYTDNAAIVTAVTKNVGFPVTSAYTFAVPSITRVWCILLTNDIVTNAGTAWIGAAKLTGTGSAPKTVYDLVSTQAVETITFIVKSTYTNSMTHLSPVVTIQIICGNSYEVSAPIAPTNP